MDVQKYFDMFSGIKLCVSLNRQAHKTTSDQTKAIEEDGRIKDEMCEILCRFSVFWREEFEMMQKQSQGNFRSCRSDI